MRTPWKRTGVVSAITVALVLVATPAWAKPKATSAQRKTCAAMQSYVDAALRGSTGVQEAQALANLAQKPSNGNLRRQAVDFDAAVKQIVGSVSNGTTRTDFNVILVTLGKARDAVVATCATLGVPIKAHVPKSLTPQS
jgi:hypothetical protein